ncbi:hypothetical protein ACFWJ5_33645 [Streptomyces qaidamensis]|uniref:hypothetical protein n=1 Tax=Streptomyces qaidamensis TaxID=1783515 RepID=UPI003658B5F5
MLITDRDDVTLCVLALFVDGYSPSVGPQAQIHRGIHAGLLADASTLKITFGDRDAARGVHPVHAVDHVPEFGVSLVPEVVLAQIQMDAQLLVPDDVGQPIACPCA